MVKMENDLDIYYALGNANTSSQGAEIGEIIKNEIHWDGNKFRPVSPSLI